MIIRLLKYSAFVLLAVIFMLNVYIVGTGKTYLYKGVAYTYLRGKSGPDIDEFNLFAKRKISAGNPQPWPIAKDYNQQEIPDSIIKAMESFETVAYLIIKDDSLQHERYWDNYNEKSLSNSFSMAKTIVGILAGAAIKEGKIKSLDQPVGDFIPEFNHGLRSGITVRHLLTMSSGIEFDEHYKSPIAYPAAAYYGSDLKSLTLKYDLGKTKPGSVFRYLSGDTQILAFVISVATGKTLSDYASEKLWKPLGAENDAYWNLDKENGYEKAFCCFISDARDFARLGKLYLNKGSWNGMQIVDSSFVEESVKPAPLLDIFGNQNDKYGFKWWLVNHKGKEIFYARGILGQYVICVPELNMIVVRLGHKRIKNPSDDHPSDMFIYLDAALNMFEREE
jgi:CubicO group peptidase (beta-lactamase class C family)